MPASLTFARGQSGLCSNVPERQIGNLQSSKILAPAHKPTCLCPKRRTNSAHGAGTAAYGLDSTFQLISKARTGDQDAIERLFARHLKPLQRWASGRLPKWARDLADTDDLVQEALLQTFKKIEDFEPRRVGALQAYLRQAVLNRLRDELRRKARRPDTTDLDGLEDVTARSPLEQAIGRQGARGLRGGARTTEAGGARSHHRTRRDRLHLRRTGGSAGQAIRRSGTQNGSSGASATRRGDEPCRRMITCSTMWQTPFSTARQSTGPVSKSQADGHRRALLDRLRVLAALADVHRDLPHVTLTQALAPRSAGSDDERAHPGRWGHLKLVEPIGRGAFGQVYRARDTRLDRDVALKLLPANSASARPARARSSKKAACWRKFATRTS